jgi:hypothetical protein
MCAHEDRAAIAARVAEYLRRDGVAEAPFEVEIRCKAVRVIIPCEGEWPQAPPETQSLQASPDESVLEFSPTEEGIIAVLFLLEPLTWMAGPKVAAAAGVSFDQPFQGICANLVERKALLSTPGRGYRLTPRLRVRLESLTPASPG